MTRIITVELTMITDELATPDSADKHIHYHDELVRALPTVDDVNIVRVQDFDTNDFPKEAKDDRVC